MEKSEKKILSVVVVALVLLAIIITVGYVLLKNNVKTSPYGKYGIDTTDWKTYKDKDMGIEFKYPKDWYLQDTSYLMGSLENDINYKEISITPVSYQPERGVEGIKEKINIKDKYCLIRIISYGYGEEAGMVYSANELFDKLNASGAQVNVININNKLAIMKKDDGLNVYLEGPEKNIFPISLHLESAQINQYQDIFYQLLLTIEFIK